MKTWVSSHRWITLYWLGYLTVSAAVLIVPGEQAHWFLIYMAIVFPPTMILEIRRQRNGRNRRAQAGTRNSGANRGTLSSSTGDNAIEGTGERTSLEVVKGDMPILAHRQTKLVLDGSSEPFRPLHKGRDFGIDSEAGCYADVGYSWGTGGEAHKVPSLSCTCGFYSVPMDQEPWEENCKYVTLMVELSGVIIEHTRGFRSSHQRVIECKINPCNLCRRKAEVVNIAEDGLMHSATCAKHALVGGPEKGKAWYRQVDIEDLAYVIGVPVVAAEPG